MQDGIAGNAVKDYGVAVGIIVFGMLLFWRIFPHVVAWLKASANQHQSLADAMPEVRDCMKKLADGQHVLVPLLTSIDKTMGEIRTIFADVVVKRLENIETKQDEMLRRLPIKVI